MNRWCFRCGSDLDGNHCPTCKSPSMTAVDFVASLFGASTSGEVPDGDADEKEEQDHVRGNE